MPNTVEPSRIKLYVEVVCYILLLVFIVPITIRNPEYEEILFQQYLNDFNKSFDNSTIYQQRLQAFKIALQAIGILNTNRTNNSARYGLTKFSDVLPQEFLESKLLPNLTHYMRRSFQHPVTRTNNTERITRSIKFNIPQKVDWREKNLVSEVQRQGSCGACWAFAAVGVIETMYAIKTGKLEKFSVQELIDCAKSNDGCDGGDVCSLLYWMKTNQITVVKDTEYPLTFTTEKCKNVSQVGIQIGGYECNNFINSEEVILALIAKNGPVAVAVNAQSWQNYVGGIIQFHCDSNPLKLNHAVQIVGYDLTSTIPYYIVRNSWGEDFGDNGYLYIAIGDNLCGLAHEVSAVKIL